MPKPVYIIPASIRLPVGDDGIWSIILDLDAEAGVWSVPDIDGRANMDTGTIRDFVRRLLKAGRIERAGQRSARPPSRQAVQMYRLLARSLEAPRLRRDGRECPEPAIERMWRVMRMLRTFTPTDIAEATPVKPATAERYLRHLAQGDDAPLRVGPGKPMERPYLVVRQLGPKAPKILRGHVIYDPNAGALLGGIEAEEVAP